MWGRIAVAIVLLLLPAAAFAQTEKRIALLIGNQGYGSEIGRLANPHNDVALLEKTLKGLRFEVTTVRDADLAGLHRAVNAYARRVQAAGPNAVGFFYYSGHGAADAGTNYLIPVDVKTTETGELWDQSLRLTEITRKLKTEAGNATHFVVFDACRNTLKLTNAGSRALVQSKGFVPVAQESGMLIAYATAEGELASDVGVDAGPYAMVLAEEIVRPGIEAVTMFRVVQRRVRMAIKQEPYLGFNAMGDVYLAGADAPPPASPEVTEVAREWARVDKTNVAELETFVRRHGSSAEADYARARIEELKKPQVTPARKNDLPAITGMLQCESYSDRPACETDTSCAWVDNGRRCQRKSGGLATAILETLPASKPTPEGSCAGVEALVGNEKRCLKPKDRFKDCPECPEMVVVPAGAFIMGSPPSEPGHSLSEDQVRVTIARPLAVGVFTVTFAEWDFCVHEGGCNGYKPNDEGWGRGKHPVINVSWDDAKAFVAWLSRKTGKNYRLPSDSEREYVARAGTTTPFWWGSTINARQANYRGTEVYKGGGTKGEFRQQTVPIDTFVANPWGLYNVHGNIAEWTEDCGGLGTSNREIPGDGRPKTTGDCAWRILRGGFWDSDPEGLRSASRLWLPSGTQGKRIGFRLARTLSP